MYSTGVGGHDVERVKLTGISKYPLNSSRRHQAHDVNPNTLNSKQYIMASHVSR